MAIFGALTGLAALFVGIMLAPMNRPSGPAAMVRAERVRLRPSPFPRWIHRVGRLAAV